MCGRPCLSSARGSTELAGWDAVSPRPGEAGRLVQVSRRLLLEEGACRGGVWVWGQWTKERTIWKTPSRGAPAVLRSSKAHAFQKVLCLASDYSSEMQPS